MGRRGQAGFTRTELIVVVAVVVLAALVLYPMVKGAVESALATSMKSNTRAIWISITSANADRDPLGLKSLWPANIGFNASRTSTEYFRLLMSDSNGVIQADAQYRTCSDLSPVYLGGAGVPRNVPAPSFTHTNNAWSVLCVGNTTDSEVPFLVSRNVAWVGQVTTSTPVTFNRELPFRNKRVVWGSRGGGCFEALPTFADILPQSLGTNTLDVMRP